MWLIECEWFTKSGNRGEYNKGKEDIAKKIQMWKSKGTPQIPEPRKWSQEALGFKASLNYIVKHDLKTNKQKNMITTMIMPRSFQ